MQGAESGPYGVSGCRLSDGRLHLGHFLGCFHPEKVRLVGTNFFVVDDQLYNPLAGSPLDMQAFDLLIAQIYSLPTSDNVLVCLRSSLFPIYSFLYEFAQTVNTL